VRTTKLDTVTDVCACVRGQDTSEPNQIDEPLDGCHKYGTDRIGETNREKEWMRGRHNDDWIVTRLDCSRKK